MDKNGHRYCFSNPQSPDLLARVLLAKRIIAQEKKYLTLPGSLNAFDKIRTRNENRAFYDHSMRFKDINFNCGCCFARAPLPFSVFGFRALRWHIPRPAVGVRTVRHSKFIVTPKVPKRKAAQCDVASDQ